MSRTADALIPVGGDLSGPLWNLTLTPQAISRVLTDTEFLARVLALIRTTTAAASSSGAPVGAQYLVLAADGTLTDERVFGVGRGLSTVDAGAGLGLTLYPRNTAEPYLTIVSDVTLRLLGVGSGEVIEVGGRSFLCSEMTSDTLAVTDNLLTSTGADSGGAMTSSGAYHIYISNSLASYMPSRIRASLTAPSLVDGVYYLGTSGNALNWRCIGHVQTTTTNKFYRGTNGTIETGYLTLFTYESALSHKNFFNNPPVISQTVYAETGVTDDLTNIYLPLNLTNGCLLILKPEVGHTITIKHNTGNIQCLGSKDQVLSGYKTAVLMYNGSAGFWVMCGAHTLDELGAAQASVDFNQQQALSFRVENRTSDPGSPAAGQIWLRTDL